MIKMNVSDFYRAPLYLELHRFRYTDEKTGVDREFDLTFAELRALTALTKLLAKQKKEGDKAKGKITLAKEKITLEDWKILGERPVLSFKWNQYLKAYYEVKEEGKVPGGNQTQIAKQALLDLCKKTLKLSYYRKKGLPTLTFEGPLVEEKNDNERNTPNGLTIAFHPIFIDNIETFFVLKPPDLLNQICNYLGCQQAKRPVVLFIEWLLTKEHPSTKICRENLIERLWLQPLREARKTSRIDKILQECFNTAKGLGFLRTFDDKDKCKNNSKKFIFKLNPELCPRVKRNKKKTA